MLRAGGNAVDAALAAAIALTVVEPTSNGIGGDLFALVWDGSKLHGLNSSGRAPRALDAGAYPRARPRRDARARLGPGHRPRIPAGWQALHERFGRSDRERVYRAGIEYARGRFAVSPVVASSWARFLEKIDGPSRTSDLGPQLVGWAAAFAREGRTPRGRRALAPPRSRRHPRDPRPRGRGRALRGAARRGGHRPSPAGPAATSPPTTSAAHRADWVEPIGVPYRDSEVWEIPPNGQGIAALMGLSILEGFDLTRYPHVSTENWHLEMEAMKLAFADVHRYVGDPDFADVPVARMLSADYAAARRALVGDRALPREPGDLASGGTVYLCTADRDGMMVSLIQSNYPRLRERHRGFPAPGSPSTTAGSASTWRKATRTSMARGKRPFHTIIPAFLTRGGTARRAVRGDGGADAAPGTHPGRGGDPRPRAQSPGGARRSPLAGSRRPRRGDRARRGRGRSTAASWPAATVWCRPIRARRTSSAGARSSGPSKTGCTWRGSDPRADGLVAGW